MTTKLTMTRQDVFQFWADKKYAAMMIFVATSDYTAARCCILNVLFSGFTMASQAIEKLLKAMIYLESGEEMKICHNPYKLKEKLKGLKDYDLDRYDELLKKLFDHYQSRYYDNKTTGRGASSEELPEIDTLWLELLEKLPVPDEAKYRLAFFDFVFDPNPHWKNDLWLTIENKPLAAKLLRLRGRYQEVRSHLYPLKP